MTLLRRLGCRAGRTLPWTAALLLTACGLAVGDSGSSKPSDPGETASGPLTTPFAISTTSLPAGTPAQDYPTTPLQTTGATGSVTWNLASGTLPSGLTLSGAGVLSGRPQASGSSSFVVRARTSGGAEATRSLQVAVGVLALTAELAVGKAWSERPVTLVTHGASAKVTFRAVANGSGGRFLTSSATTGRATWAPGATAGEGVVDRLEVLEDGSGRRAELTFGVMPDPVAHHVAEFSSTDVWFLDVSRKMGSHSFGSDFHDVLARIGLRSPTSFDATGTLADRLAEVVVRRQILRELNQRYLREPDGRAGVGGLPISFPWELPGGYERPAPGSWLLGSAWRYNVIGLHHANTGGGIGLAFQDSPSNELQESNTTGAVGELGVFCNRYVELFLRIYGDDLAGDPITDADAATLEALLYGTPTYGARGDLISRIVRAFAKASADFLAHEIGHSLGLQHTSSFTSGSLMNSAVFLSDAPNAFTAEDRERLARALPGVGRFGGSVSKASTIPQGVEPCTLLEVPGARPVPSWSVPVTR